MFYFLLWCALSTCQVILNKRLLNEYPFPLTLTATKLGVATLFALLAWILRLRIMPRKWLSQCRHLIPVVVLNTLGLSLVDYSLFSGTVFVNQTTRAAQSSTTIIATNTPGTIWAMAPIVMVLVGIYRVIVASTVLTDVCFVAGMISNLAVTLRGVYSKRVLWQHATPANNFGVITMLSFLSIIPVSYYLEGDDVKAIVETAPARELEVLLLYTGLCGLVYFLSIEVAYAMFDPKTSPFTRSLQEITRQIVTIAIATFYFQENITQNMAIGYGIALAGQLLQSLDQPSATTSKQLSVQKIRPKKASPLKLKKRT